MQGKFIRYLFLIFFSEKLETKVCDWLAYPDYSTNQTLSNFVLTNDLYHINAIEWSASAMEMSVIGAKNVANMIIEKYGISKEKSSNIHSRSELWLHTYPSIWIEIKYRFINIFQKITLRQKKGRKYRTRAIISRGFNFFFTQFSLWLQLILQIIYVQKVEILHFLSSKSAAYKRERLQIESGLWWHTFNANLTVQAVYHFLFLLNVKQTYFHM